MSRGQAPWDANGNLTRESVRRYTYDHANRLKKVVSGTLTTQYAYNGHGARVSKTVDGATTDYVLDLAATLPVAISDTETIYLYGLDIIAQQQAQTHYMHDGGLNPRENWELGMCVIGRGSERAEGRIDPVGGVLGSFDIRVELAGIGKVRFEVHNRMDRESFGRLPGEEDAYWLPRGWYWPVRRDPLSWWPGDWWGTTVHQHFYWYELDPLETRN